jgi:hypothetical protein
VGFDGGNRPRSLVCLPAGRGLDSRLDGLCCIAVVYKLVGKRKRAADTTLERRGLHPHRQPANQADLDLDACRVGRRSRRKVYFRGADRSGAGSRRYPDDCDNGGFSGERRQRPSVGAQDGKSFARDNRDVPIAGSGKVLRNRNRNDLVGAGRAHRPNHRLAFRDHRDREAEKCADQR